MLIQFGHQFVSAPAYFVVSGMRALCSCCLISTHLFCLLIYFSVVIVEILGNQFGPLTSVISPVFVMCCFHVQDLVLFG